MTTIFTYDGFGVFKIVTERTGSKFWASSARRQIEQVLWDGNGYCLTHSLDVHPQWPLKGEIQFTRGIDGRRFSLFLRGKRWVVRSIGQGIPVPGDGWRLAFVKRKGGGLSLRAGER
jgi:hypothetical protein